MNTLPYLVRVMHGPDVGHCVAVSGRVVIGRGHDPLDLTDPRVSRRHAELMPGDGGVVVRDLGSGGGTTVAGHRVATALVRPGGTIELGGSVLRVLQVGVASADGPAAFVRHDADGTQRSLSLTPPVTIGRDPACDVVVDHPSVSRRHATLTFESGGGPGGTEGDGWSIADERSSNGTTVNGRRITTPQRIHDGDELRFGTAPVSLRHRRRPVVGDLRVRLGAEGDTSRWAVVVTAAADTTTASVLDRLVEHLGLPADDPHVLVRTRDGVVLHPDVRWGATGTIDGDELVVAVGEAPDDVARVPLVAVDHRVTANQLPRHTFPPAPHTVRAPDPPDSTRLRGRGLMWQVIGGLVAVAGGLALSLVRPEYWIFGAIMGAVGLTSVLVSISSEQARRRRRMDDYRRRIASVATELDHVRAHQTAARREISPDDDALAEIVTRRTPRLWERTPRHADALALRIGTGTSATALTVEQSSFTTFGRHEGREFDDVVDAHRVLDQVPVCLPGIGGSGSGGAADTGSTVGITGARRPVLDLAARMVVEAAALHPPDQLHIWVLSTTDAWDWCRWMPHVVDDTHCRLARSATEANALAAELTDLLRERSTGSGVAAVPDLLHLVVVPHDALDASGVAELARHGVRRHGRILALADDARRLPTGVRTLVTVDDDGTATLSGHHPDPPLGPFGVMRTPLDRSMRLARSFASVALGRRAAATGSAGLVELATGRALGDLRERDIAERWRIPGAASRGPMSTPVGVTDDGAPMVLDFRRDGPHGMIAGTTGSGKSELLQTLLAGLVLTHPPDALNLFLIDFKGGATFSPLATLPHVVGLVTDLEHDDDLAVRAFTALDAEIERRKRLLDRAGVPNIVELERSTAGDGHPVDRSDDDADEAADDGHGAVPHLPNLLVVIDEFALLVKQQPELRDRLDTVATQGRSLGIHLLLATQSPTGVITNAIRTNTNLWLCLRVVSDAESTELIGSRDAARIPTDRPGRGFVRSGAAEHPAAFQAARIARDVDDGSAVTVEVRPFADDRPPARAGGSGTSSPLRRDPSAAGRRGRRTTELEVVVERVNAASASTSHPPQRQLWSPPLPARLGPADLLPRPPCPPGHLVAAVGRIDVPERQLVETHVIDLTTAGHLLVLGVLGSGRTTALRQVAADLAAQHRPDRLHLYAIDAGAGSLVDLAGLPHTAGVVPSSDEERLTRTIARLHREMDERRALLARRAAVDFAAWRRADPDAPPWIVLVVDDLAALRPPLEAIDGGRIHDQFTAIVNGGPAVGIHLVVSVSQLTEMRMSHLNLVTARIVLRASDPTDFQLIDQRVKAERFTRWPPGRGLVRGGWLVQLADPGEGLADAGDRLRDVDGIDPRRLPRPVERLPRSIELSEIDVAPSGLAPRAAVLGIGGDDGDPVVVDLERGNGMLLVVGPNQSGRTTTLCSLMASVMDREPDTVFALVAPRHNALRALSDHPRVERLATSSADAHELFASLPTRTGPPLVVLVDDAELLALGNPDPLEAALRAAAGTGNRFVVAARTTDLQALYDPWARYIQTHRYALALQAGPPEAYLLGLRPVAEQLPIAGRGLLHERGRVQPVQVHRTPPPAFSGSSAPAAIVTHINDDPPRVNNEGDTPWQRSE